MRRYRRRLYQNTLPVRSEINMTSLIDVMMSLLAIFMITAPLLTSGIPLSLPRGDGQTIVGSEKTLDISVDAKGNIFVGTQGVTMEGLAKKVQAIVAENPHIQIVISGDRHSAYGRVIEVMALLRAAGFSQVGLKTDAESMKING